MAEDDPAAVAAQIGRMARHLAGRADKAGFDVLAYLLEMAALEADQAARSTGDEPDPSSLQ